MAKNEYIHRERFPLECGHVLPELRITYHTYGKLSPRMDNIIWVCHALTANSDVADWWPNSVEQGRFLDPERYFIICANILGSHYGTTGPLSVNPSTGVPYYGAFPTITVRDVVKAHILLAEKLEIKRVKALIGGSIGGFQVAEWMIERPEFAEKAIILASATKADAWVVALNESQRMALKSDQTFGDKNENAAGTGLMAARSIALLSYRSPEAYIMTQSESENDNWKTDDFRASSYQRYQGKKLALRFNAYSYYILTKLIDSHNIARGRVSIAEALKRVRSKVALIAISTDTLYPIKSMIAFHENIKGSEFHIIESSFGHDGFLVESDKINNIITKFMEEK